MLIHTVQTRRILVHKQSNVHYRDTFYLTLKTVNKNSEDFRMLQRQIKVKFMQIEVKLILNELFSN